MKKKAVIEPAQRTGSTLCFLASNPGSGFITSHADQCCKVVGGKDTRHACRRPVTTHAKRGGWCGNVCRLCGEHEAEQGATLSAVTLIVEQPRPVLLRAVADEPADTAAASETLAAEPVTASAAGSATSEPVKAAPAGNGSASLLDRILARTAADPILRSDLTSKERKLARDLAAAGVIMRDEIGGRIKYYAKGAA